MDNVVAIIINGHKILREDVIGYDAEYSNYSYERYGMTNLRLELVGESKLKCMCQIMRSKLLERLQK